MSCRKCDLLLELYECTPKTPRDYWVMTELFVMLHGSDVCHDVEELDDVERPWLSDPKFSRRSISQDIPLASV